MKRLFSGFFAVLMLCIILLNCFCAVADDSISADNVKLGDSNTYYSFDEDTGTLTISGTGATPDYSANGAGQPWYEYRDKSVNTVIIENGITALGNYLLYYVNATTVTLPDTLTKIGDYALSGTFGVTSWDIPYGVTYIGQYAFNNDNTLTSITLPDSLITIGNRAFQGCTSLENITVPYSVTAIGDYAFNSCTVLSSVNFESLTSSVKLGAYCFQGCGALKTLTVPLNATMGKYSFGYKSQTSKYSGIKINVYKDSNAYSYAVAQSIGYTLYTNIPTKCAVGYANTYTDDNIDSAFNYTFTADTAGKYYIYTRGDCDVCTEQNDNISLADNNFAFSVDLAQGESYSFTVSSVKSTGTYTLWIYPDGITSFSITGTASATATANMTTVSDDSLLTGLLLNIKFDNGLTDNVYYTKGYFAGYQMEQKPYKLNCGNTTAYLQIGTASAPYQLYVNHSYTPTAVSYTVDDDGYNLYKCVNCTDSYKADFVATPAIKVKGRVVFAEDKNGNHPHNVIYPYVTDVLVDDTKSSIDRHYTVDSDGNFTINTFNNISVTVKCMYGRDYKFSFYVSGYSDYDVVDYGDVAVKAYDLNGDYRYNAKDYGKYLKEYKDKVDKDYMQFFSNFVV